ncbi:BNR repeat-like domain protein [Bacteroides fragilis str. 3988 T1]|uniref:sialidase family protein n=1 Tax=Bacteroides fragilis TaxID=817 RepID=UPI00044BE53D|nr:sialidase family protein [Bacteroides fragilis]EXY79670.1 BNR repeat-like domain protein [Bacteroides fragilis str. 3988 T1]
MKRLSTLCLLAAGFFIPGQAHQARPTVLDSVYAPLKVATPPSDAYIGFSLLDNGEIRHYNYGEQAVAGTVYLASTDHGLTWKRVNRPKEMPFADCQSPVSKEYIRLVDMGAMGVYCIRTSGGLTGGRTLTKVADRNSIMIKPPVFIRNGKRIVVAAHGGVTPKGCYTYFSDDDGLTWKCSNTVTSPDHQGGGFHKGIRWNHGAVEPTVVELKDGTLWMLMRTSQDFHYQAFSKDGGQTWGESEPSPFYGTITMPTLGRLADGRLLLFWCNTTPLPEKEGTDGVWDDVFTNRDVTHVAVSDDDGKTWKGFRELYMDPMRNDIDYAVHGGGIDRGVHQAQFVEVAPGKVLASIGQHPLHRAMMMFDVNWLYEKSRFNDFTDSLSQWSTFNYMNGIKGHCAYNRIQGCMLEPHPRKEGRQVLHLTYRPDASLVADTRGAVWNFPAMKKGTFTVSLRIPEGSHSVSLLLNDRWMNPSDTVARYQSMYELPLTRKQLGVKDDRWHEVSLEWDLLQKHPQARVRVDGRLRPLRLPLKNKSQNGISYVHFIAPPAEANPGVYLEWVRAEADGAI